MRKEHHVQILKLHLRHQPGSWSLWKETLDVRPESYSLKAMILNRKEMCVKLLTLKKLFETKTSLIWNLTNINHFGNPNSPKSEKVSLI